MNFTNQKNRNEPQLFSTQTWWQISSLSLQQVAWCRDKEPWLQFLKIQVVFRYGGQEPVGRWVFGSCEDTKWCWAVCIHLCKSEWGVQEVLWHFSRPCWGQPHVGLFQSVGMLGIGRWTTFPRGHRKGGRGRQGKEGLGRKWERKRERERAGRRGNERILFFLYLSFPCYLPYDFLIHQNAGKIMFWAK